jgi:hypothetical protein
VDPPADSGLAAPDLTAQARDTAERARRLLAGDTATLHLTAQQDAVRLTVSGASLEWFHALQAHSGLPPHEFARLTRAWRHGGAASHTWGPAPPPTTTPSPPSPPLASHGRDIAASRPRTSWTRRNGGRE